MDARFLKPERSLLRQRRSGFAVLALVHVAFRYPVFRFCNGGNGGRLRVGDLPIEAVSRIILGIWNKGSIPLDTKFRLGIVFGQPVIQNKKAIQQRRVRLSLSLACLKDRVGGDGKGGQCRMGMVSPRQTHRFSARARAEVERSGSSSLERWDPGSLSCGQNTIGSVSMDSGAAHSSGPPTAVLAETRTGSCHHG